MTVSPQYVAEHFDDVAAAVKGGVIVDVSLPQKPILRLVLTTATQPHPTVPRVLGAGRADGDGSSISFEQWKQIDREWKQDLGVKFGDV